MAYYIMYIQFSIMRIAIRNKESVYSAFILHVNTIIRQQFCRKSKLIHKQSPVHSCVIWSLVNCALKHFFPGHVFTNSQCNLNKLRIFTLKISNWIFSNFSLCYCGYKESKGTPHVSLRCICADCISLACRKQVGRIEAKIKA